MACSGDSKQLCGGGEAANVYENSAYIPPAPVPTTVPSSGSFQSKGCFSDSTNSRLLPKGPFEDNSLTVANCVLKAGYARYVGVENGNECFYGNVLSSTAGSSNCNKACTGEAKDLVC